MEFATELDRDDHAAAIEILGTVTEWKRPEGRDYFVASVNRDSHPLLEGCTRAFFLKVEPGGSIHRHVDAAGDVFDTDLIVVTTNPTCRIFWETDGVEYSRHLELGKRYRMNARTSMHWANNDGDTARVNLLIEYPKGTR